MRGWRRRRIFWVMPIAAEQVQRLGPVTAALDRTRNMLVEAVLNDWNLQFELVEFPLEQIRTDPTQQVRETTHIADPELGEEYLTQHRNGAQFPAIVLRAPGL